MKVYLIVSLLAAIATFAQPYEPRVIWDRSGETDSSAYAWRILPLGDQNDDGFADWAVYARGNMGGWHGTREGYVEFFHGGNPPSNIPYFVLRLDTNLYEHMWGASSAGDLNRDGYLDWLMLYESNISSAIYQEAVYLGGPGDHSQPDLVFSITYQMFGLGIGDFNGDDFDDLFMYDFGSDRAEMLYGGVVLDTIPDWVLCEPPSGQIQSYPQAIGDFTGDGSSDFICYNPNPPYNLAIFLGGFNPDTIPAYFWTDMRRPIGGVSSMNGDAADELLFSASGGADVHFGGSALHSTSDAFLSSGASHSAVGAGDFNHDGYDDVLMFTDYSASQWFGTLDLHLGHPWLYSEPTFVIDGWTEPLNLIGIWTAAGLGDVNGDSVDDIAVGAYDDLARLGWRGRCVIIAGDDSLVADVDDIPIAIPSELTMSVYPNPFNGEANIRLQCPPSQGTMTLTTFNLLGQVVQSVTLPPFSGEYIFRYSVPDLSTGLYFLRAESGTLSATEKLMLVR